MKYRDDVSPPFFTFALLFTLSGGVGLLYEVVWVRRLTLVFGNTTYASSAVLAIFFTGLALGAACVARWSRGVTRPLRLYAVLEIGLGLYAAATPRIFDALLPVYRSVYRLAPDNGAVLLTVQVVLCALVLGLPTGAMGATLPVLSAGLARMPGALSARIGRLYAWNTAGAAAGTLVTGFVLLGILGMTRTLWLGAAVSVSIGLAALYMFRREPAEPAAAAAESAAPGEVPRHARLVLGVMAASGAVALAYEVTWTRLMVYTLTTAAYAFALMLVTYLLGLALGGFIGARLVRWRRATLGQLAWAQVGTGVACAVSFWILLQLPDLRRAVQGAAVFQFVLGVQTFRFAQCVAVMLGPTLFLGAMFPLAVDLLGPGHVGASRAVGRLYAWNTLGGVAGSLMAGFLLIPALGTGDVVRVGIAVNGALAGVLIIAQSGRRACRVVLAGAAAATLVLAAALGGASLTPLLTVAEFGSVVEYQDEGISGTVTIHRYPETGVRVLSINGSNVAGTTLPLITTQKIQGHIPALLHGHPRSAMQIGFGSGETAKVLKLHGVETIHGVELSREVIAAGDYLAELNGYVAYSSRFQPIIMDAVNYARLTDRTYDLILNDSIYPGLAGSSALYTRDHFAACAARLNPGGIFSCWLPLDVPPAMFRTILASLTAVFPHTQLWLATNCDNKHALLTGSFQPLQVDPIEWARRTTVPQVWDDLHSIRIADATVLASYLLLDSQGMAAVAGDAPLNTHDLPLLEYAAYEAQGWRQRWRTNLATLLADAPAPAAGLAPTSPDGAAVVATVQEETRANRMFLAGVLQELAFNATEARRFYELTLANQPDHRGAQYALAKMQSGLERVTAGMTMVTRDPAELYRLAEAYWRAGTPADAVPVLEGLLAAHPGYAEAEELLVVCGLAARQPEPAARVMGPVLARHPEDPTWRFNAALLAEMQGRLDEARGRLERLLEEDARNMGVRLALARVRMQQGDYTAGERLLLESPAGRDDARWHHLLAVAYAGQGRMAESREAAMQAVQLAPDSAEQWAFLQYITGRT